MAYTDYMEQVMPAVRAEIAQKHSQWADQQRAEFDRDPFSYAQGRAMAFMQDGRADGLDPKSADYGRVAFEANLEAQRTLSGGDGQLAVMSRSERERYRTMLLGESGGDGPQDTNTSFAAIQEIQQRFGGNQEHLQIAYQQLGIDRGMAPIFSVMGKHKPDWLRIGVMASDMSVQEQIAYTAELRGTDVDTERSQREALYRELEDDERIQVMFGPMWNDRTARQYVQASLQNLVTSIRATKTSADDFFNHIDTNFQQVQIETGFYNIWNNPANNLVEEVYGTVVDFLNPFGGAPGVDDRQVRVNVLVPKGVPGALTERELYAMNDNNIWAKVIAHSTGMVSGADVGRIFDLSVHGPKAMRAEGLNPQAVIQWGSAMGIEDISAINGKLRVIYSRTERDKPSVYGQQRAVKDMTREEFMSFATQRSENLLGKMFNFSQLVGYGGQYYLRYERDGESFNMSIDPQFLREVAKEMSPGFYAYNRWIAHPFRYLFEPPGEVKNIAIEELWEGMLQPALKANMADAKKLWNAEFAGSSFNREIGPLLDMAGRGFGTLFNWMFDETPPEEWTPKGAK